MHYHVLRPILRSALGIGIVLLVACGGMGTDGSGVTANTGIAGSWSTPTSAANSMIVQLALAGTALSGSGTITVPPISPSSGPATPTYTGNDFTITSGTYTAPDVQFSATLGSNPDGAGGFYHGTLSFTGSLNNGTLSGSMTFTPPRTASQTFSVQTVGGMTLNTTK